MKQHIAFLIINDLGEILLQKRTADYKRFPKQWTLFGGGIDDETPLQAAKRELKEELGLKLVIEENCWFLKDEIVNYGTDEQCFVYKIKLNDISKIKIGEGNGAAFFSMDEIENLNCVNKKEIKKWL